MQTSRSEQRRRRSPHVMSFKKTSSEEYGYSSELIAKVSLASGGVSLPIVCIDGTATIRAPNIKTLWQFYTSLTGLLGYCSPLLSISFSSRNSEKRHLSSESFSD